MLPPWRRLASPVQTVSSLQTVPADTPVVQTEAGPVSLQELPVLNSKLATLQQQARDLLEQARSLRTLAEDRLVDLGSFLLDSSQWKPPEDLAQLVDQSRSLESRIADDTAQLETLR